MLLHEKDGYVSFYIVVIQHAQKTCIVGVVSKYDKMVFKIHVHAAPERGKANQEIVCYLSDVLKLPKNFIVIDQGETDRFKRVKLLNTKMDEVKKAFQTLGFLS